MVSPSYLRAQMQRGRGQPGSRHLGGRGRNGEEHVLVSLAGERPLGRNIEQVRIARQRATAAVGLVDQPLDEMLAAERMQRYMLEAGIFERAARIEWVVATNP